MNVKMSMNTMGDGLNYYYCQLTMDGIVIRRESDIIKPPQNSEFFPSPLNINKYRPHRNITMHQRISIYHWLRPMGPSCFYVRHVRKVPLLICCEFTLTPIFQELFLHNKWHKAARNPKWPPSAVHSVFSKYVKLTYYCCIV